MAEEAAAPTHGYFIDSGGQTVRVPIEAEGEAAQRGWVPASLEQVKDFKLQQQFGTGEQQAQAFSEGVLRSLTLGLSTKAEVALGANPESIAAREQANPTASGTGEAAGIIAPLLVSGGANALAKAGVSGAKAVETAAELTAPSLVSKLGSATARGVESLLPEATTTAEKIGNKLVSGIAQGAVEGGAYGAGHVVHEEALGDPNLTAQRALSEIGLSALFGGGLGGVASGGGAALDALVGKVKTGDIAAKMSDWLEDFEAGRAVKTAGGTQSALTKLEGKLGKEGAKDLLLDAKEFGLVQRFDTPSAVLEKAQGLKNEMGTEIGRISTAVDATQGLERRSAEHIIGDLQAKVVEPMLQKPFQEASGERISQMLEKYRTKFAERPTFAELHELKQDLGDEIYGLAGDKTPGATHTIKGLKKAYGQVAQELDALASQAGMGEDWAVANRKFQVASDLQKIATKGTQRDTGNNPVGPLAIISGLTGFATHGVPGGAALGLGAEVVRRHSAGVLGDAAGAMRRFIQKGAAEEVAGKTAEAIAASRQAGSDAVFASGAKAPEAVAALSQLKKASDASAQKLDVAMGKVLEMAPKAARRAVTAAAVGAQRVEDNIARVSQLANSPELLQQHLTKHAEGLAEHAPNTAMALQTASARAIAFLASKAPQEAQAGPLGPKLKLSEQQKWTFQRYYDAVERPTDILQHAAAGTLTPMDVEAVRTCFPALYQDMQQKAFEKLAEHKGPVPYKSRLMLSMLMGQDVDGTLSPQAILSAQAVYMTPSQKSPEDKTGPAATGRATQTGMGKLSLSRMASLPGQSAERRRGE